MQLPEKAPLEIRNKFKIVEIDPECDSISDTLGISNKRFLELTLIAELAYKTNTSVTKTMADVSEYVLHPNELGMVLLMVNKIHTKNALGPFGMITEMLGRKRDDSE